MLVLALSAALAQEPGAAVCLRSLGGVTGLTFGRRDFDFTTPGQLAWSGSPMLSQLCERIGTGWKSQSVVWIGLDAMPTLAHSYNRLGERSPVWAESTFGIGRRFGRHTVGLGATTNFVQYGITGRWTVRLSRDERLAGPSLELRAQVVPASDPDVRLALMLTFSATRMDPGEAPMTPGPRFRARLGDLRGLEPDGKNRVKQQADAEGLPTYRGDTWVGFGFEAGTAMGLRAELVRKPLGIAALRAVIVTSWAGSALLQPSLLASVGHRAGPTLTGGVTRHDGAWIPVGGAAWTVGGTAGMRLHLGMLVGPGYIAPDLATVVAW